MKTPDEIKKALECCFYDSEQCGECPYYPVSCDRELVRDAREYIRQIEARNAELSGKIGQLEAEIEKYEEAANKCCYESQCNAEINQLEALCKRFREENEQLQAERDALIEELKNAYSCFACKKFHRNGGECKAGGVCMMRDFEWRGVKKEE